MRRQNKAVNEMHNTYEQLLRTPYGSLIKTYQIYNKIQVSEGAFVKMMKHAKLPFVDEDDFIDKTLKAVGYELDNLKPYPVMVCKSKFNTLFCPWMPSEDGEPVPLPLEPNGMLCATQKHAETLEVLQW